MSFLSLHHGTYWFQIRVPKTLVGRYGRLVRQNLSTSDRSLAQQLGYSLAGTWLARFGAEKNSSFLQANVPATELAPFPAVAAQATPAPAAASPPPLAPCLAATPMPTPKVASGPTYHQPDDTDPATQDTFDGAFAYWRQLSPHCAPSTHREIRHGLKTVCFGY